MEDFPASFQIGYFLPNELEQTIFAQWMTVFLPLQPLPQSELRPTQPALLFNSFHGHAVASFSSMSVWCSTLPPAAPFPIPFSSVPLPRRPFRMARCQYVTGAFCTQRDLLGSAFKPAFLGTIQHIAPLLPKLPHHQLILPQSEACNTSSLFPAPFPTTFTVVAEFKVSSQCYLQQVSR